jgi:hypothetical protein
VNAIALAVQRAYFYLFFVGKGKGIFFLQIQREQTPPHNGKHTNRHNGPGELGRPSSVRMYHSDNRTLLQPLVRPLSFFPPQSSTTTFLVITCARSRSSLFQPYICFAITEQANGGRDEGEAKCRGAPIRAVFVHVRELLSVGNLRPLVS